MICDPGITGYSSRRIKPNHRAIHLVTAAIKSAKRQKYAGSKAKYQTLTVVVEPDASDAWRLDPIVQLIKDGSVGIIPTDTFPALICDLECRPAVQLLYQLKGASPSKKLSILCRNFHDISTYTLGFPVSSAPGQPNFYKIAKAILPGPFTLILQASKSLPKQITNFESGRSKSRSTVGVRLPDDPVCQAILQQLDRPLLCTTATVEDSFGGSGGGAGGGGGGGGATITPDAAVLEDVYGPRGLAFIVDAGPRSVEPSTVIDLSTGEAVVVRAGKGDTSWFLSGDD